MLFLWECFFEFYIESLFKEIYGVEYEILLLEFVWVDVLDFFCNLNCDGIFWLEMNFGFFVWFDDEDLKVIYFGIGFY